MLKSVCVFDEVQDLKIRGSGVNWFHGRAANLNTSRAATCSDWTRDKSGDLVCAYRLSSEGGNLRHRRGRGGARAAALIFFRGIPADKARSAS
jgi:hypothetical protein